MMHREVVMKKRTPVIAMLLIFITAILYIVEGFERSKYSKHIMGDAFYIIVMFFTILLIIKQIRSCFISYKYAIIADKLIINLIINREEKNLESIRMSDVLFIGYKSDMPKEYKSNKKLKSYLCNRIGTRSYYCVYKSNNEIKKIKFQPSDKFINRIIKHGNLKCNLI